MKLKRWSYIVKTTICYGRRCCGSIFGVLELDKKRFKRQLESRIPARWHMSFICMTTIACGILFSKSLLFLQVSQPMFRYGIAVALSYLVFFLLIYLWLRWHFGIRSGSQPSNSIEAINLVEIPMRADYSEPRTIGGGGNFSGAGAGSNWDGDSAESISADRPSAASEVSSLGDLDEFAAVVLLVAVVVAISGSAFYVVYQAPEILFEAAFEAMLVAGLFRRGKRIQAEGWANSIFKRTWLPFGIVMIVAMTFGFVIKYQCPAATSFSEYRNLCWGQKKN